MHATCIDGEFLRPPWAAKGLASEGRARLPVTGGGAQQATWVALCLDGAVYRRPFPFQFSVGLVKTPAPGGRELAATEPSLNLGRVLDDPAVEGGMIHGDSPLTSPFLTLAVRKRGRSLPPDAPQEDCLGKLAALQVAHATAPPPHD